jgi:hypothetical protein
MLEAVEQVQQQAAVAVAVAANNSTNENFMII